MINIDRTYSKNGKKKTSLNMSKHLVLIQMKEVKYRIKFNRNEDQYLELKFCKQWKYLIIFNKLKIK